MLKLCSCGTPIDMSLSKCDSCKAKKNERHQLYDKYRRDKEAAAFYKSKSWQLIREQALLRDLGLCQYCLAKDKITLADMVDHIIPVKEAWELRLVLDNLQSLCNSCHAAKTSEDKKKYK
ncbi:HNH endonuclease [Cytobacillus oceanisediminis]|uniref:HNH endonuclease n=1 Tax=Cytobacillus oceanisediminis TaxID=665099 RepID=UPI00288B9FAD|nr:HNH endonuclease signature motif containing protein [Cytobacillus oceanisediminis]